MKKIIPWLLIFLGLALLFGAATFWADTLTSVQPASLGQQVRDWLTTLSGLVSAIAGVIGLFKKDKGKASKTQNNIGDNNTNIQGDTVNVYPPIPKGIETHNTIGFIPSAKVVTYIERGIEDDVIAFLKNGGNGAIVGLHAPGGLGKTELAKHVAEEMKGQFDDVLWVDVGEKNHQQVVADTLIKCAVQTRTGASYEEQRNELRAFLKQHKYLIVLDDIRQKSLEKLDDILPPKPCTTLLTSRMHDMGGVNKTFPVDAMTHEQAKELMEAVLGEDTVNAESEAAAKLAERCAYNPLAVEIAARRIRQFAEDRHEKKPVARYFALAQTRFGELYMHGNQRWDMKHIFDLSYDDLSPDDQNRFNALAAFHPTGFAPQAAAFLWETDEIETANTLSRFFNLSLAKMADGETGRYRLHDLLDEYAQSKLTKDLEKDFRNRLAQWIIALFSEYYTEDRSTAPQVLAERANLLRSCEWARGQKNGNLLAQLITQSRNWFMVSFVEDWTFWFAWLEASLKLEIGDKRLEANVLQAIGDVQQFRDDRDAALVSYNEALKLFKDIGAKLGEANVISSQGQMYLPDDINKANEFLNQALQIYQKIGSMYSIPAQIGNYGWKLYRLGESEKAKPYLLQAADLFEKMGLMDYAERHRTAANK